MTRRHDALLPLTHDHHHVLAKAKRLRVAADGDDPADLLRESQGFVDFFNSEGEMHFREEEEELVPLFGETLPQEAVEMLEDHVILRGLVRGLAQEASVGSVDPPTASQVADRFSAHVRFEEKVLFPLIESAASEEQLNAISLAVRDRSGAES